MSGPVLGTTGLLLAIRGGDRRVEGRHLGDFITTKSPYCLL